MKIKILLVAFCLLGITVYSQTDSVDLFELSLEDLLKISVVTSTQNTQELRKAPSNITVYSGADINKFGIRNLSELIEFLVPGAMATEDGDSKAIAFRGIASDNDAKVLLLFNNHYYNTQWNNGPTSEVELGLLGDIKQIEVINGPGAALYGSGATMAVINIITEDGGEFNGVKVSASTGIKNDLDDLFYKRADLNMGAKVNDDLDVYFSMGGLKSRGLNNNDNGSLNINRMPLSYRFFGLANYKDFKIQTRFTNSSRTFYNQLYKVTAPSTYTSYGTFFFDVSHEKEISDNLSIVSSLAYDAVQTTRYGFETGTKLRAVGENRYSVNSMITYTGIKSNTLVLGTNYRYDDFGDDWYGDLYNFSMSYDTAKKANKINGLTTNTYQYRTLTPYGRDVLGIFLQDQYTLIENKLDFLLGARADYIEAGVVKNKWGFTPRVALVYSATSKLTIKSMYSTGFRQPLAVLTSGDNFIFGGTSQTNSIETPEKVNSAELMGTYQLAKFATIGLNTFYNTFTDIHGLLVSGTKKTFVSAGKLDIVGGEFEINLRPVKGLMIKVMHQYSGIGKNNEDNFNIHAINDTLEYKNHLLVYPENVTKAFIDYKINNFISFNTYGYYVFSSYGYTAYLKSLPTTDYNMPNKPVSKTDPYFVLNANINFTYKVHKVQLSVYNLNNTNQYVPITGAFGSSQRFVPQAERSYMISYFLTLK